MSNRNNREAIIDWGIYQNPFADEAITEVAGAHCEAGKTDNLYDRINDFKPRRSEKINREKVHGEAEFWAHKNSFELMDEGCKLVIWISPPDKPGGIYQEGRINFMVANEGDFKGWGIPAMRSGEELVEITKKLEAIGGVTMDGVETVEQLREQPIGFKDFDEELKQKLEEVFKLPGFWQYVEGEQKIKKAKVIAATKECLEISEGNNAIYFREMARRGFKLMAMSDHGSGGAADYGASGFEMSRDGYLRLERKNGRLVCPCGQVLDEGQTVCPKCGLKVKEIKTEMN